MLKVIFFDSIYRIYLPLHIGFISLILFASLNDIQMTHSFLMVRLKRFQYIEKARKKRDMVILSKRVWVIWDNTLKWYLIYSKTCHMEIWNGRVHYQYKRSSDIVDSAPFHIRIFMTDLFLLFFYWDHIIRQNIYKV